MSAEVAFSSEDHHDHDHEHDHHGGGKALGAGKAIVENSPTEGIRLNPETVKKLGITLKRFVSLKGAELEAAIVIIKDQRFLYRETKGHYELVAYPAGPFKPLDQIVATGTNLIRISEVYANDESEYGHSH